jgi:stage II sporulation protein D
MRTRIALVLSCLTALTVLAPTAAHAAAEPWVAYNSDSAHYVKILTHGSGHGIGLSQYGAKGRAEGNGGPVQNAQQILGFYYKGTTKGAATGQVRVWITEDSDANTIVRPSKGLRVVDLGNGKSYTLPPKAGATAWRLTFVAGKTRVAWLKAGVWHYYRPGGKLLTGNGEFHAASNALNLYYAGANHPYRGAMRLVSGRTINVVSLDNYLKGVVPAEMPALWATEALKAQAVAARTYAAFERVEFASRSFHVYDTTQSQVYKGIAVEQPQSTAAIAATSGWILVYGGKPAFTQFSASNGGMTAKPGTPTPYLIGGRPDPYDKYATSDPQFGPVTKRKLEKKYPKIGTLKRFRVLERDTDGRVLKVELDGTSAGTVVIKGTDLRGLVPLRSTYFSFTS